MPHQLPVAAVAAVLALSSFAPSAWANEIALPVEEHELENGLRLLIHEDHDIPNVALYMTWKVGSRNEHTGITGLAHFFEHMMFTGGAQYGKSFDPVMESAGGSNNAWTSADVTTYTDWFPRSALPLVLEMEADRMRGMVFEPEVVESERNVVASERRLSMETPDEVMYEQLLAAAYTAHPYQWSVLGWMVDIQSWKQSDLEEFFATHYAPDNATLVIAGDVDPAEVLELVRKTMGPLPRGPERRPIHTVEPPQLGERRVEVEDAEASLPQILLGWHMVETASPRFPAFEVLEAVLLHGESSRLHRLLVEEKKLCLVVDGGWNGHQFDPSLFYLALTLRADAQTTEVERLLYAALERLAAEGPGERELRKVKNQLRARFVRRMRTIDGKAELLSETDTFFGGWRNLGRRVERIEAVTADDVKAVVKEFLTKKNRSVCTLIVEQDSGEEE